MVPIYSVQSTSHFARWKIQFMMARNAFDTTVPPVERTRRSRGELGHQNTMRFYKLRFARLDQDDGSWLHCRYPAEIMYSVLTDGRRLIHQLRKAHGMRTRIKNCRQLFRSAKCSTGLQFALSCLVEPRSNVVNGEFVLSHSSLS